MAVTLTVDELRAIIREEVEAATARAPRPRAVAPEQESPYLTIEQAAALAQRSQRTVLEWVRGNQLRAKKRARRWVVHRRDLEAFMTLDAGEACALSATERQIEESAAKILRLPSTAKAVR